MHGGFGRTGRPRGAAFAGRRDVQVQSDLRLLILSAAIGLCGASLLELVKYWIERRRQAQAERQALQTRRSAELAEFLRGAEELSGAPEPAWLRLTGRDPQPFRLPLPRLPFWSPSWSATGTEPVRLPLRPARGAGFLLFRRRPERRRRRRGRKLLLGPLTVIGRSPLCDLCLPDDPAVSSEHALIRYEEGGYVLYDLGSINGTHLNGLRLAPHRRAPLQGGDRLRLGRTHFEFGAPRPPLPPVSAGKKSA